MFIKKKMIMLENTLSIQGMLIIGMYGGTLRKIINKHGFCFSKTGHHIKHIGSMQ
jgi:hypothetical protein